MKSLYEGILNDIESSIVNMDDDLTRVRVIEWLTLHCRPDNESFGAPNTNGHFSSESDWNIKLNSDGSVDILSDMIINWNLKAPDNMGGDKIPFKIRKIKGHFTLARSMSDISNFPDIVDSFEITGRCKITLKDWHLKIENSLPHKFGYYKMPFKHYHSCDNFPALIIPASATIGKNVVFECTRMNHNANNRPVAVFASLTEAKLKNMKLINFPYIILEESRIAIPKPEQLKKYSSNIKDVKLISSSLYNLNDAAFNNKVGMLIKDNDNEFKYVPKDWFLGSIRDIESNLTELYEKNKYFL